MSLQDVHRSESLVPLKIEGNNIIYQDTVYNNIAFIVYSFNKNNKLESGALLFKKKNIKNKKTIIRNDTK